MIDEIAERIAVQLKYQIVGKQYARLGHMLNLYGYEAVVEAITNMSGWSLKIKPMMDYLEKQAQKCAKPLNNADMKTINSIIGNK